MFYALRLTCIRRGVVGNPINPSFLPAVRHVAHTSCKLYMTLTHKDDTVFGIHLRFVDGLDVVQVEERHEHAKNITAELNCLGVITRDVARDVDHDGLSTHGLHPFVPVVRAYAVVPVNSAPTSPSFGLKLIDVVTGKFAVDLAVIAVMAFVLRRSRTFLPAGLVMFNTHEPVQRHVRHIVEDVEKDRPVSTNNQLDSAAVAAAAPAAKKKGKASTPEERLTRNPSTTKDKEAVLRLAILLNEWTHHDVLF